MKIIKYIKGGLVGLLLLALSSSVWAWAGNIYVAKSLHDAAGVSVQDLYAGSRPDQGGGGATVTLSEGIQGANYKPPEDVGNYVRYTIYNSPNNPAYIIFDKDGTDYHISRAILGATVPTNTYIDTVRWYKRGEPTPPVISEAKAGYETAQAKWTYPSEYEYRRIVIQVIDQETDNPVLAEGDIESTEISISPTIPVLPEVYNIGELVDGRVLKTDVDGHAYRFELKGLVDGQPASDAATQDFSTLGLGAADGAFTISVPLKGEAGALGIHTFSNPFTLIDPPIAFIADLVEEINRQGNGNVVQTIGWWDAEGQKPAGYIVTYPQGVAAFEMLNTNVDASAAPFAKGVYQVSVSEGTNFTFELTGTP